MATRRQFLKTIAAASAFLAVKPLARAQKFLPDGRWQAQVIRCAYMPDLQEAFLDDPDAGPCPKCSAGQKWVFHRGMTPADICPTLWKEISAKIDSLDLRDDSCAPSAESAGRGSCLVSCGNPTRPVIVRIVKVE